MAAASAEEEDQEEEEEEERRSRGAKGRAEKVEKGDREGEAAAGGRFVNNDAFDVSHLTKNHVFICRFFNFSPERCLPRDIFLCSGGGGGAGGQQATPIPHI